MERKLWELAVNEEGIVAGLAENGRGLTERLRDLGFTPGSRVRCIRVSPMGDPAAYRIRGALIALRQKDAALVALKPGDEASNGQGRSMI